MKAAAADGGTAVAPSSYWHEELAAIDYISEASPLIVRRLRHHAVHITGLRPYDYRQFGERQAYFEQRLDALLALAGGRDLLVAEAEALGGFGYSIGGQLYNVDPLKFFEVLVGMRRAGLIDAFSPGRTSASSGTAAGERPDTGRGGPGRAAVPRRLVWEIGAGWGGFAYQFKTLFPDVTYAIVDFAEMFLFSATYLRTLFPEARVRFWREGQPAFAHWQEADFVFIPHDRVEALREVTPDLLVNLVSFHEMTSAQVDAYARLAASIGCPAVYSLNRDRSVYNDEVDGVGHILSRHYDVREIRLLGSDYTKATKKGSATGVDDAARAGVEAKDRYRHLVGTLRTDAAADGTDMAAGKRAPHGTDRASHEQAPDVTVVGPPFTGRQETEPARVGIGVTLHNRAMYLREALDSLLAQSYPHFRLVLVDDGSKDDTESIAREYERRDPRVRYVRCAERQGMIAAWRRAFELATAEPVDYFAWASDHDRWNRRWLDALVAELEAHPEAVLAYPLTERMDAAGMPLAKPARRFETGGIREVAERWRRFSRSDAVAAGDMVYGLMRPQGVRRAGIFREVLCPDRLLLAELTLQGQIRQVPEVLWHRRQFSTGSVSRQRESLFAPGAPRPGALTPPWWMHARTLWETYGSLQPGSGIRDSGSRSGDGESAIRHPRLDALWSPGSPVPNPRSWQASRLRVARMVAMYTAFYAFRHVAKTPTRRDLIWLLQRPRWAYKRAKHGALVAVYASLIFARRIGITPAIERWCERLTGRARPWRRAA